MRLGNPLILSDTILVREDTGPAYFDSARFQAPNREALLVSEARFYAAYPAGAQVAAGTVGPCNLGYETRISLSVGPYIMCDRVPIWGLEPSRDPGMECPSDVLTCYRWRFLRPIFIPPGIGFTAAVTRSLIPNVISTFIDVACPISCTLVARVVEGDFPRSMIVPCAASWAPVPIGVTLNTGDRYAGAALMNLLDKPIEIKYAIGRVARVLFRGGVSPGPMAGTLDIQGAASSATLGFSMLCEFKFENEVVAPSSTEFNAIFDHARRCLPLANVVLKPGQRPLFRACVPTGNVAGGVPSVLAWAPNVTLVGYRKEATP